MNIKKLQKLQISVYCIDCFKNMEIYKAVGDSINEDAGNFKYARMRCPKCHTRIEVSVTAPSRKELKEIRKHEWDCFKK